MSFGDLRSAVARGDLYDIVQALQTSDLGMPLEDACAYAEVRLQWRVSSYDRLFDDPLAAVSRMAGKIKLSLVATRRDEVLESIAMGGTHFEMSCRSFGVYLIGHKANHILDFEEMDLFAYGLKMGVEDAREHLVKTVALTSAVLPLRWVWDVMRKK